FDVWAWASNVVDQITSYPVGDTTDEPNAAIEPPGYYLHQVRSLAQDRAKRSLDLCDKGLSAKETRKPGNVGRRQLRAANDDVALPNPAPKSNVSQNFSNSAGLLWKKNCSWKILKYDRISRLCYKDQIHRISAATKLPC